VIKQKGKRWDGHVARVAERRVLVGKLGGKRLLDGHRIRWEDNIKIYLWVVV
jgi:hypothetical protein